MDEKRLWVKATPASRCNNEPTLPVFEWLRKNVFPFLPQGDDTMAEKMGRARRSYDLHLRHWL